MTPADPSSTSLGIGLSITFKAGVELLWWLWGVIAQWSEHLQLKQEALGSIPGGYRESLFGGMEWWNGIVEWNGGIVE